MEPDRPGPIRVLIVDDHPLMRYGLRTLLASQPDMTCAGEAEDGARALALCRELHPDVVLMDMVMPRVDGPTAIAAIHREMPEIRIIALTTFADVGPAQQALLAGAASYLLKNLPAEEVAGAVRAVHAGRRTFAPEITEQLALGQAGPPAPMLTPRELEVLNLIALGMTDTEIAARLYISKSTARFHISGIFTKLGTTNRTEAVRSALDRKLIE
jgi:DNA-binding NarL/FixJ family response regulator